MPRTVASCLAVLLLTCLTGCTKELYNAAMATRPYPADQHLHSDVLADGTVLQRPVGIDAQTFRDDTDLIVVNSTANSYHDFDMWINQRYMRHVDALEAGQTIRLSLWDFYDEWGGRFNAGGFFRAYQPTPVRLVEIQLDEAQPMLCLVAIQTPEPERAR